MEPVSRWYPILRGGRKVGDLTNCTWSYRLKKNIGFALISKDCGPGDAVDVSSDGRTIPGRLTGLPFI
jgi:aminomethyltransferase